MEQFSSYMMHNPTFPAVFASFWAGSFLIVGSEEGNKLPGPLFLQFLIFWIFLLGVCKIH
jgi:hypothetical protein